MTRRYIRWQLAFAPVCLLAVCAWNVQSSEGQTTYNFINPSNSASPDWHDSANWDPTGIPNAAGDEAIFTRPTVTPSEGFTIFVGQDTTIGSITIDSTSFVDNHNFTIDGFNPLIFQTTSGSASYTETDGGTGNERITVWNDISVLSDLVVSLEHQADLNSSSIFNGLITGASDRTITKVGLANWQLSFHGSAGFEGQYEINEGGIRLTGASNIQNSTGVTVNSGGQLQFNANDNSPTYDWNLANGAVLNLNGTGKTGGSASGGALRFQGQAGHSDRHPYFHNPVVLQSDALVAVGPAQVTAELDNVVSGPGGLAKNAPGTLILSNPGNSYEGDTSVQEGIVSITSPFLANDADVYILSAGILDLNFTGTDVIDSLFIDDVSMDVGLWGGTGNTLADFTSDLITGDGLLDVQTMANPGVPGDYNNNGVVDAADYVLWRKSPGDFGGDPDGYNTWVANFGNPSQGGGANNIIAGVPEPCSALLALFAVCGMLATGSRK